MIIKNVELPARSHRPTWVSTAITRLAHPSKDITQFVTSQHKRIASKLDYTVTSKVASLKKSAESNGSKILKLNSQLEQNDSTSQMKVNSRTFRKQIRHLVIECELGLLKRKEIMKKLSRNQRETTTFEKIILDTPCCFTIAETEDL